MSKFTCSACCFCDACAERGSVCEFYAPVAEMDNEYDLNTYIEMGRQEYRDEYYRTCLTAVFEDDFSNCD